MRPEDGWTWTWNAEQPDQGFEVSMPTCETVEYKPDFRTATLYVSLTEDSLRAIDFDRPTSVSEVEIDWFEWLAADDHHGAASLALERARKGFGETVG